MNFYWYFKIVFVAYGAFQYIALNFMNITDYNTNRLMHSINIDEDSINEKLELVKLKISQGTYIIDTDKLAQSLLNNIPQLISDIYE